jgi:glutamine---fructose-6-phosphate transaminase (isomerizing)
MSDQSARLASNRASPARTTAMLREIEAIPEVVGRLLAEGGPEIERAASAIRAADPGWVSLVARGTSDHAAIHLRYLIETELGIPAGLAAPSTVTIYGADLRWRGGLVVAVSQSGRSPDLVAVVAAARAGGAITVAIVNDAASPLAAAADHVIDCRAGEERSVAATKSYVAQLAAGALLVAALAPSSSLRDALPAMPRLFAEGYSSADFSHGPVVLTGPEVPILAIRPDGRMGPLVDEGIAAALATGSVPWIVGGAALPRTRRSAWSRIG